MSENKRPLEKGIASEATIPAPFNRSDLTAALEHAAKVCKAWKKLALSRGKLKGPIPLTEEEARAANLDESTAGTELAVLGINAATGEPFERWLP